jgi:tyrosyl-tRNA synthetase
VTDAQRERAERAAEKKAAAERKKAFQRMQAADDLIHLQQQKHDVLILYGLDEGIVNDPDKTLAARRAAYSRNITRNDQVRRIEKQIEKAQFILTEP